MEGILAEVMWMVLIIIMTLIMIHIRAEGVPVVVVQDSVQCVKGKEGIG